MSTSGHADRPCTSTRLRRSRSRASSSRRSAAAAEGARGCGRARTRANLRRPADPAVRQPAEPAGQHHRDDLLRQLHVGAAGSDRALLKSVGLTHVVVGGLVDWWAYHGQYSGHDYSTPEGFEKFLDLHQWFWDHGSRRSRSSTRTAPASRRRRQLVNRLIVGNPRAQKLIRIVVMPGWEPRNTNGAPAPGRSTSTGPRRAAERAQPDSHRQRRRRAGRHRRALQRRRQDVEPGRQRRRLGSASSTPACTAG
jgi:hypothetical protein